MKSSIEKLSPYTIINTVRAFIRKISGETIR